MIDRILEWRKKRKVRKTIEESFSEILLENEEIKRHYTTLVRIVKRQDKINGYCRLWGLTLQDEY